MYVLGLNGSHNKDGNTAFLLGEVLKNCQAGGATVEIESVHDAVMDTKTPFCVCCSTPCSKVCYKDTKLEELFDKVEKADVVVFGSPVYFGSMSAQLKAFFDKTRDVRSRKAWLSKPMAVVTSGASKYGGQERTIDHIQSCALVSGMTIIGNSSYDAMGHFGVSAQKPAKDDTYAIAQCKVLAQRILSLNK